MSKKILIIALFCVLGTLTSKAQYINLSDEPDIFIEQADSLLKQWGRIGDSTSNNFSAVWFELSNEDQEKVIAISRTFRERKYKVNPYFISFYSALYNAVYGDFSERMDMGQFLDVGQLVIQNAESPKEILRYFFTARNLFDHGSLYYSKYNLLNVPEGASFVFEYVEPSNFIEPVIPEEVEQALQQDEFAEDEEEADEEDDWGEDDWSDDDWSDDNWSDDSWDDDDDWGDDNWDDEGDDFADFDDDENPDNYDGFDDFDPLGSTTPVVDLPAIEGATIKIENADFDIYSPYDTFQILNVTGTYVFGSRSFVGDTGVIPITIPLGEYETEAEVTLGKFAFNTINPNVSAENAVLDYPDLFEEEIKGSFIMRSVEPKPSGKKYPVFRSYKSNHTYKDIGEGVQLTGGFTLLGRKINTQGQDLGKNYIEIKKDDELILKGSSQRFFLRDTLLKTHKMNLVIYQNEDSLYHPSMGMGYDMNNNMLSLYWENGNFKDRPMINSYHEVDIVADKMWWDLNTRQINFGIIQGRSEVPAIVSSLDNFDDQEYIQIKGLHKFHPVQAAAYFSKKKRMNEFSFFELAEAYRIKPEVMKRAVIVCAGKGYLDYDEATGLIRINSKTKHAYNSNFKKGDFDNMEWYSISPTGQNITMDLDSGDMIIRGVKREIVSKALKVYYKPDSGIVVLKKNRDFKFDGEIEAGNYRIKGQDFAFNYDAFHITLTHIDSIRFDLQNDSTGESSQRKILGGQVENTSGMFYLNEPGNKSGNKKLPQYPILDVLEPSFVYFDDPDILGGIYDRRMYFEIPNFSIDTIESDNPSVINLDGTFHSDGLLPTFNTTLGVNDDLSLGFRYIVPEEGFTVFENDEARFYDTISMGKDGLTGTGTFKYLTSTTETRDVTFYQDSMVAHSGVIDVEPVNSEHGGYPDARCDNARGVLVAANERYIINSKGRELVKLYEGEANLKGAAMISKKGMFGIGTVKTKGTNSKSENFKFSQTSFTGRNAEFFIEAEDEDTFALAANNARLFFDFEANTARLEPEKKGDAVISLPLMSYNTSIPVGTWDLDEQTFTMEKPANVDIEDSYFYSTLEDQDSLAFNGTYAVYDAVAYSMTVKGVPGIYVADAYITPGDSTVIIDETALIQPLENASLAMNSTDRWHFMNEGEVDIYSRNKFEATGIYKYVNSGEDTMDIIFEDLYQVAEFEGKKKTDSITIGESYLEEDANFYIAPKIIYQGDVNLFANREFLEFDGEIRLDLKHSDEFNDWLPFQYGGDPDDIRIELKDERELEENEPLLTTGIHVDGGESKMYYTFLSGKLMDEDPDIFKVTGFLSIDAETGEFKIGSEKKLSGETKTGNLFTYNDETSIIKYEGELNLYGYMPEEIQAHSYGSGRVNIDSGNYTFNTLTYLNFPIPGPAMNEMGMDMSEETDFVVGLPEATNKGYDLIFNLSQMIGQKAAENYDEQLYIEYIPLYMASGKFGKSILFADLDLKWHEGEGALYSGDSVGLASIGKNDVNGKIKGYYEIKKLYEDEIVNLFIELTPSCWYYISYDNGALSTFSSNHAYNEIIEAKAKTPESGNAQGELYLASADLYDVVDYVKYYNETYLGRTLKDEDINLKISKPERDEPIGGREFADDGYDDKPQEEKGWGEEEEYDDGWGSEEDGEDDGWGSDEEDTEEEGGWGAPVEDDQADEIETTEDDDIETSPVSSDIDEDEEDEEEDQWGGWGADEEEEDDGWASEDDTQEIVGAPPPKAKKEKKEKKKKDKKPKEIPVIDDFEEEEEKQEEEVQYGGGWGSDDEEEDEEDGWGFGDEDEEEDDGWGSDEEDDDNSEELRKAEEERKAREEADRKAKEDADRKAREEADRKAKEEADRKAREEEERRRQEELEAEEEEEEDGWGFGSDDEEEEDDGWGFGDEEEEEEDNSEELRKAEEERKAKEEADRLAKEEEEERKAKEESDRLAKEEEERKANEEAQRQAQEEADLKAKEEAEQKAKEEAERKAKEEADRLAKEEEERKAREEEERRKEEEAKKIEIEEEEEDDDWGFGSDDEEEEDDGWGFGDEEEEDDAAEKKAEEERKAKELEEKKAREEAEKKAKEESEKKAKEEEEKKKKEEELKKKKEEEAEEDDGWGDDEEDEEDDDWDGF